ncbi:MAG: triphosphoribosyl-dephospho-CoA synthase [Candidatus Hydrothermarchaeota archaeon]
MSPKEIGLISQLASILEASSYPKPGNVHRFYDFEDVCLENFLASGIAIGPPMEELAKASVESFPDVNLGKFILDAVNETKRWQKGGNTNLGIILLFSPLCSSGSVSSSLKELRTNLKKVVRSTTPEDSKNVYKAIKVVNANVGKLEGEFSIYDVYKAERDLPPLWKLMEISSEWDNISREWTYNYEITFEVGFKKITELWEKNINSAMVETFLTILSKYPDSLIRRKAGMERAVHISRKAKDILKKGGVFTSIGKKEVIKFDRELQKEGNVLNPGTTADLLASSIWLALWCGYRP